MTHARAMGLVMAGLCSAMASTGAAQDGVPPDSVTAAYYETLLDLRDTVATTSAAAVRFRRNLSDAGDETVVHQSQRLRERCRATRAALQAAAPVFLRGTGSERQRTASAELRDALVRFRAALSSECVDPFEPAHHGASADSLRLHGPALAASIERAVSSYQRAVNGFTRAWGLRLPPRRP